MDIKKIRKEKINRLVVYEIMQWIDEHLEEPLRVDDVSARAGYSKWHFQRMFKEVAGISLGRYIKLKKLRRACFLLESTDIPVIEVCLMLGFTSQQVFTRAMRNEIHQTPGAVRRNKLVLKMTSCIKRDEL
ncbi:helix-turn-helix domain-containing protein [Enterobacter hormaechei subsp. hoffmannii]|uniref:Helix-turn-helix domain-containing protein n=1 Tax=Salmonella senftenberg TaxID=28150 RepID=A0A725EZI8_SALSE|nr:MULTISPECIES: helix-turn-helix domain-containing protein [Enterobacteriaceae]EMD7608968.1 helix-turn-helix domain-containing protein [Cronobacter sakazakii]HAE0720597.1 helix-turn-helix domain-containing protein [Salmonella enterica subsp. enterica serovar Senftenberg]HBQ3045168.1 helix-turn-helix domain-containing protein [Klebsiella quasipneumoniae subsp. similipneumoniae]HCD6356902.1 helix-turn-helix domain-containing protein [Klebsiella variicola]HEP0930549.1 helix-turn-helix domain-con